MHWQVLADELNLTFSQSGRGNSVIRLYGDYQTHLTEIQVYPGPYVPQVWINLTLGTRQKPLTVTDAAHALANYPVLKQFKGELTLTTNPLKLAYTMLENEVEAANIKRVLQLLATLAELTTALLTAETEAILALEAFNPPKAIIIRALWQQIVTQVAEDSTTKFGSRPDRATCSVCLRCFGPHQTKISPFKTVTYYGCRRCRQSRHGNRFWNKRIFVTLDRHMQVKFAETPYLVRVNWFQHTQLFDFDCVEIIDATDQEVEHFMILLGNDTDPLQRQHYRNMKCRISTQCHLTENTLRILQAYFRSVEFQATDP